MTESVDFFNIMTYDMHGVWDKGNKWTGDFLNTHTNLTEITEAMDLLWRNDIHPSQVVLGTGFYGRAFTMSDRACSTPGCHFASAAQPGRCSREGGILMNSEIQAIMAKRKVAPKLYKDEAVKVLTWDDQWVGFDDEDTLQIKADFARSQCISGLMVWAVSHDTEDSRYSYAVAQAANRKSASLHRKSRAGGGTDIIVKIPHDQCRWTNCGETCPAGWKAVDRLDKGNRGSGFHNELMLDETGCDGTGVHTFCCPGDDTMPVCGWYNHNNGKCDPKCPSDMIEVGGTKKYCNNGKYQAACCQRDHPTLLVYDSCAWSDWPNCKNGQCPASGKPSNKDTVLASSVTGSGGSQCDYIAKPSEDFDRWGRKLCCDVKDEDDRFEDCDWYHDIGPAPKGRPNFCRSGCPPDKVRVALDLQGGMCVKNGGARARCCAAIKRESKKVPNPEIEHFQSRWSVSRPAQHAQRHHSPIVMLFSKRGTL
jgi:hypothetical protein